MALQGKPTPERGFANFLTGVLDGYVKGRGLEQQRANEGRAQAQEQRSQEMHMLEVRLNDLQMRKADAELREHQATEGLRRQQAEADIKRTNALASDEVLELKRATAAANAERAAAMAEKAEYEVQIAREKKQIRDLINRLAGMESGGGGFQEESFQMEGDEIDTRDMPALDPSDPRSFLPPSMQGPSTVPGIVPGGRRILTGPPQEGNVLEEDAANPLILPGEVARTILPPGVETPKKKRAIPVQDHEIQAALSSKDANDAVMSLITGVGEPFGAAAEKRKREDPLKYQNDIESELDRHMKQYPAPYKAFREGSGMQSRLRARMLEILTSPDERAWQSTRDTDAAASQAVAELSLEELLKENSYNPLLPYLSMDRVNDGNVARYNGRLLNLAMRDAFGAQAQNLAFSDDLDYTLRQVVEALYSDSMAANGNAQLGFTQPLTSVAAAGTTHPLMDLLDAYWEPVRRMDKVERLGPGQFRNPLLSRPGRE